MGFETVEVVYPVVDCPVHPQSALRMPSGRSFCLACGLEVLPDVLGEPGWFVQQAPEDLTAEVRTAWSTSRVIRDFAANCQPGATQLTPRGAQ